MSVTIYTTLRYVIAVSVNLRQYSVSGKTIRFYSYIPSITVLSGSGDTTALMGAQTSMARCAMKKAGFNKATEFALISGGQN